MSSPLSSITPMSRTVGVSDTADPHTSIVDIAEGERTVVERKMMASVFVSLSRRWLQFSQRLMSRTHSSIFRSASAWLMLHAADGIKQGRQKIVIRTVHTDAVVLTVSFVRKLGCESLVVAIGTGKSFRYADATAIAHVLGVDKCKALPVLHALTVCDTTSCFAGRGKRTAWHQ